MSRPAFVFPRIPLATSLLSSRVFPVSDNSFALVWFRDDLRIADNPALNRAVETGIPVLCLFIHDPQPAATRALGGAAKWWLAGSLKALNAKLAAKGARLDCVVGDPQSVLADFVGSGRVKFMAWNRRYGAAEIAQDTAIKSDCKAVGVEAVSFNSHLLNEPWEVIGSQGGPIRVFTPYWRAASAGLPPPAPLTEPSRIRQAAWPSAVRVHPVAIESLALEPTMPDWSGGLRAEWMPGEDGARARLDAFVDRALAGYGENRNRPDYLSTSRLSPHLRFGEISVRQCWHAATMAVESEASPASREDLRKFQSELGWREFSYHLLFHYPRLATENYSARFDSFPWVRDAGALKAWRKGMTGYPIVDAGMRELWATGWMHNRVRMIVGSFLVKHLLIHWREGEEWFWDTLVDADPASNAASWQWVAGSGADAAPYFRIFNPMLQGAKFDPYGDYVRRWVPEIDRLPPELIHQPWLATPVRLSQFGVKLGRDYPEPIIEHDLGRQRALDAFQSMKPVVA